MELIPRDFWASAYPRLRGDLRPRPQQAWRTRPK
jgi:hypothetical protein